MPKGAGAEGGGAIQSYPSETLESDGNSIHNRFTEQRTR